MDRTLRPDLDPYLTLSIKGGAPPFWKMNFRPCTLPFPIRIIKCSFPLSAVYIFSFTPNENTSFCASLSQREDPRSSLITYSYALIEWLHGVCFPTACECWDFYLMDWVCDAFQACLAVLFLCFRRCCFCRVSWRDVRLGSVSVECVKSSNRSGKVHCQFDKPSRVNGHL